MSESWYIGLFAVDGQHKLITHKDTSAGFPVLRPLISQDVAKLKDEARLCFIETGVPVEVFEFDIGAPIASFGMPA